MKYKKIIFLLLLGFVLITLSAVAAEDNSTADINQTEDMTQLSGDNTFYATGASIAYSPDSYYDAKLTKKAQKQIKAVKKYNKNHKTKYKVTVSKKQYDSLLTAKNKGKVKEIQIKTDKYIKIKKPVFKKYTKKVFLKKYYKENEFKKAYKKLKDKYWGDSYKIKVKTHWKRSKDTSMGIIHVIDYKQIKVIKKCRTVKYFKNSKARITASVVVNDYQNGGGDWVYFGVSKFGLDGLMASSKIKIG